MFKDDSSVVDHLVNHISICIAFWELLSCSNSLFRWCVKTALPKKRDITEHSYHANAAYFSTAILLILLLTKL